MAIVGSIGSVCDALVTMAIVGSIGSVALGLAICGTLELLCPSSQADTATTKTSVQPIIVLLSLSLSGFASADVVHMIVAAAIAASSVLNLVMYHNSGNMASHK
jgi:hypothetical protein